MAPPPVDPTAPTPSPASKPTKAQLAARKTTNKRNALRSRKGKGKGRRGSIPWLAIEDLYIHGEVIPTPAGTSERVWPSAEDIAARFEVDRVTVQSHARAEEWVQRRENFRADIRKAAETRAADFVHRAGDLWNEVAQKAWAVSTSALDECRYALEFHRSGAATLAAASTAGGGGRGRNRPGGGDSDAQGDGGDGAPVDPSKPSAPRLPMPARDQKDIAAAMKTNLDNMRGLLFGQQPPATAPTSAGGGASGGIPSIVSDPRVSSVLTSFLTAATTANKAPPTDAK